MTPHCKGCKYHHNAGHPKDSKLAPVYNDWCTKFSRNATKVVNHCKLKNGKEQG